MSTELDNFFKNQGLRPMGTLAHFGVRGMKWGVRNVDNPAGTNRTVGLGPVQRVGVKLLERDQRKFAENLQKNFVNDLKSDSEPKNVDHPIYKDDVMHKDGVTSTGSAFAGYKTQTGFSYRKYDTGEKSYNLHPELPNSEIHLSASGKKLNSLNDLEAYKKMTHFDSVDDFIAHFGIRGMKWGVRRSDAQLAKSRPGTTESDDAVRARNTLSTIKKSKSIASVSDADLQHLVNRINLEKRYSELDSKTMSAINKRNKQAKILLAAGAAMNEAIVFANSTAGRELANTLGLMKTTGKHATGKHAAGRKPR